MYLNSYINHKVRENVKIMLKIRFKCFMKAELGIQTVKGRCKA